MTATASDDVGVARVQFRLDGQNLGAADTSAPFEHSWDTRSASNGAHSLSAVATDAAGNETTSTAVPVSVNNQAASGGLVAAYGFEEGTGTSTADATGTGHLGTLSGAAWSTAGRNGRALSFDGVNDWVTVADANDLDLTIGMTIEAWVFPTTTNNTWRTAIAKEQTGGLAYALFARSQGNGRPRGLVFTAGEQIATGSTSLAANTWTHLTATYDGLALRLYVNGTLSATRMTNGPMVNGAGPLHFGGNTTWGEWFAGRLDDIRIYNRTLTPTEIQTDMQRAVG